jgi:SRSO17 transposase
VKFTLGATRMGFGNDDDSDLLGRVGWIFMVGLRRKHVSGFMRQTWRRCWVRRPGQTVWGLLCRAVVGRGRKSVEPLAAVTAPERTAAQHQSLLHLVAQAAWSDQAVLTRVRQRVLPSMTRDEPVQAWIIDDTGFPKKGEHSVGVARQYCGQLGKLANCQVAVSLSLATHQASLPVAYRLYLPKDWADDPSRRAIAGVPEGISFQTKPEIALRQLRLALADGVPPAVVLMDPAYGADSKLRAGISELGLS